MEQKITRADFENGNFKKRVSSREEHIISKLLKSDPGHAYTSSLIKRLTKMNKHSVNGMLRELVKDGLVIHKSPFYAWKQKPKAKSKINHKNNKKKEKKK